MAITAMGIGTKTAPADVNLDPQSQFWSFLTAFVSGAGTDSDHSARAYFSGFRVRQNDPVGMSVLVGGEDGTIDSAAFKQSNTGAIVLLSTDGTPQEVTIATAPASGSRIDAIVSYIDKTNADASKETAGTPQYVKTIAVQGTAASNPSAPTNDEITAALPTGVGGFYRWADVKVGQGVINITDDNVSDAKPASPNVYLTTQVNQNKNDITTNRNNISSLQSTVNGHTSQINSIRNKDSITVRVVGKKVSNTNMFTITAPNVSGYKFVMWVAFYTAGFTAAYGAASPQNATTDVFFLAGGTPNGTVNSYALYVADY